MIQKAVVIFYGHNKNLINGSVVDSFEYFYTLWEQDKNIKYVFIDAKPEQLEFLKNFFNNRYIIDKDVLNNIIRMKRSEFIVNKFKASLCTDSNTMKIFKERFPLNSEKRFFITEFANDKFILKNAFYFSEMDAHRVPGDEYYYTKMRFDLIRPPKEQKNKLYVNAPSYGSKTYVSYKDFLIKIKETVDKYKTDGFIEKFSNFKSNIFEDFKYYLYIKTLNWDDPRPRMFHECYFFNIPIEYYNKYDIKDGSYYRYKELMENGLENRFLTKNDTLIQKILNV